jgi:GT2 family glycosyltransferase
MNTDTDLEITVVIPHYNGLQILDDCLVSLYNNHFTQFKTILIDNGSTDGSQQHVRKKFPQVELIQNEKNLGYAGACNQGIEFAKTSFILLLNNDTVMPENFLDEMYSAISENANIAAVQPKILSIQQKDNFDYSGGAGGELDIFGYPFARGRIFDDVEQDKGQYDSASMQVFWTSGCALLLRKGVVDVIGKLDEDFFAHQEEIDLNWRAQLAGFQNRVTMKTYIYHYSGYTLRSDNEHKMYLNHRNNLIMMLKNYSLTSLIFLFPMRLVLEFITILADYFLWHGVRYRAVEKALSDLWKQRSQIKQKRRVVQQLRKLSDRQIMQNMYKGSVVFSHFLMKKEATECVQQMGKI